MLSLSVRSLGGVTLALALALVAGCGDNSRPVDIPDTGVEVPYDGPEDFDRSQCQAGVFAGTEVREAVYHLQVPLDGYEQLAVIRLDADGGLLNARPVSEVRISDDDIFLRREEPGDDFVEAIDLCGLDADGTLRGTYAYCFAAEGCFAFPLTGRRISALDEAPTSGLTELAHFAGPADAPWPLSLLSWLSVNVRVVDDIAYVARYNDGLRIVDLHDLGAIRELAHLPVEFPDVHEVYNDVKNVDGPDATRYALMASSHVGIAVVDVTTPATPRVVSHLGTPPPDVATINVHTVFVDGTRAYLGALGLGLEIWDIADPAAPARLGAWFPDDNRGFLHDLYVEGDRAYLNFWDGGMHIVDVADPAAPRLVKTFVDYGETTSHSSWVTTTSSGRRVALHGDEEFDAHLHVVDVDEASPTFGESIAEWQTRPGVSIHNVMASGDLGIVSYYQDGVRILDLADPAAPRQIAWFNTWPEHSLASGFDFFEGVIGVDYDPVTRRIYAVDVNRGLFVLSLDVEPGPP